MRLARNPLLLSLLLLAILVTGLPGALVLCIENDGRARIESGLGDCCDSAHLEEEGGSRARPNSDSALATLESCEGCLDIPLSPVRHVSARPSSFVAAALPVLHSLTLPGDWTRILQPASFCDTWAFDARPPRSGILRI